MEEKGREKVECKEGKQGMMKENGNTNITVMMIARREERKMLSEESIEQAILKRKRKIVNSRKKANNIETKIIYIFRSIVLPNILKYH